MTEDQQYVRRIYQKAYVHRNGVKAEIRRPREKEDPPALVNYVLMSGIAYGDDLAWKEAAERIKEAYPPSV